MNKSTYKTYAKCTNCDYSGIVDVTKGTILGSHECPSCECKSLKKKDSSEIGTRVDKVDTDNRAVSSSEISQGLQQYLGSDNFRNLPDCDLKETYRWTNTYYANKEFLQSTDPGKRASCQRYHGITTEMRRRGL